ncbi:ATP-dependent_RNA helicase [Hexamita inflata]|uniref:ATP-dependent RNA helicase n=1 Tax=Hexamita inflata TaxID=28002 RepID=A0AA86PA23_9EUKA|nr:ATP-dependent RNA helicase [Hexamita inflata]CAI9961968.1 ATP-dependent RNA helicase [Hexamita inflata]
MTSSAQKLLSTSTWKELGIDEQLVNALVANKFMNPSQTQEMLLKELKESGKKSGMCEAPTGTGKTLAYLISAIRRVDPKIQETQAVIIVHTQILGFQIMKEAQKLCEPLNITTSLCLGMSSGHAFQKNKHIIIGTADAFLSNFAPKTGRSGQVAALNSPASIKIVVIDEADHFIIHAESQEAIKKIFKAVQQNVQKLLFTATLEEKTKTKMIDEWFSGREIFCVRQQIFLDNTAHFQYDARSKGEEGKLEMVEKLFNLDCFDEGFKAIVFCKTRNGVDNVYRKMIKMNYACSRYHKDMTPEEREKSFADFIASKTRVLITTDMMARGIDVITIAIVVNFDLPTEMQPDGQFKVSPITYVHRTGRAGRFGRKCVALTITESEQDEQDMKTVVSYCDKQFKEGLFNKVTIKSLNDEILKQLEGETADTEVEKRDGEALKAITQNRQETKFDHVKSHDNKKKENKDEKKDTEDKKEEKKEKKEEEKKEEVKEEKKEVKKVEIEFE